MSVVRAGKTEMFHYCAPHSGKWPVVSTGLFEGESRNWFCFFSGGWDCCWIAGVVFCDEDAGNLYSKCFAVIAVEWLNGFMEYNFKHG